MEELQNKINELSKKVAKAIKNIDLDNKHDRLADLKKQMSASDFWNDQKKARQVSTSASRLEEDIENWKSLETKLDDLKQLSEEKQASELIDDLNKDFDDIDLQYENLSQQLYLQGKYDDQPAILTINSGAGGVDAQDWAEMLERMFLRFAQSNDWTVRYLAKSVGSEAGIKSATFEIDGPHAYGYLKNEKGVHRLVRLSPYDSDHARHTSFAMVEVLPKLSEVEVEIKEEDLKIDTFRASGHGGQSVNTTDSAVRITHLPTGIVAICQNERSQLQNKNQAMAYLSSKLQRYYEVEKEDEKKAIKGEYTQAAWGNQIRSYVLHPYKMIKDHRTNFETTDPQKVLDGDLMPFIKENLEFKK
ncbi:peptide chain release factor 2 [Candidatus Parcubacteria bacterium]|nr:peptide chain release factor 2 [Candidatus Parcubacteria bacterium]